MQDYKNWLIEEIAYLHLVREVSSFYAARLEQLKKELANLEKKDKRL